MTASAKETKRIKSARKELSGEENKTAPRKNAREKSPSAERVKGSFPIPAKARWPEGERNAETAKLARKTARKTKARFLGRTTRPVRSECANQKTAASMKRK